MTTETADILVVGGGPAGLTAALTLAHQTHTVILFDSGKYRNAAAYQMHMVPGWDNKNPTEFRASARRELLENYQTIRIENTDITNASKTAEGFELASNDGKKWAGKKLVLALGSTDIYPDIPGYADCWPTAIYHCLFCEGYNERGSASSGVLAVQGCANVPLALHNAETAKQLTDSVTIYTNGNEDLASEIRSALGKTDVFRVDSRAIRSLRKGAHAADITLDFADGAAATQAFLVHNPMTRVGGNLAEQLGVSLTQMGDIHAEPPFYQTSVRGVFAAGDCITPYKVVPGAISSGCNAAVGASGQLVAEKNGHQPLI